MKQVCRVTSRRKTFPDFEVDLQNSSDDSLMKLSQAQGIPIASSCLGQGVCGRCVVEVSAGQDLLSPPKREEEQKLAELSSLPKIPSMSVHRLSCQSKVLSVGVVELDTPYW